MSKRAEYNVAISWIIFMSPGEITAVMFEKARFDVESALTCKN